MFTQEQSLVLERPSLMRYLQSLYHIIGIQTSFSGYIARSVILLLLLSILLRIM